MATRCKIMRDSSMDGLERQINLFMEQFDVKSVGEVQKDKVGADWIYTSTLMYEDKRKPLLEG